MQTLAFSKCKDWIIFLVIVLISISPMLTGNYIFYPFSLIIFFLPGYIVLTVIVYNKEYYTITELFLASILLSIFINWAFFVLLSLIGYLSLSYFMSILFSIIIFLLGKLSKKDFFNMKKRSKINSQTFIAMLLILLVYSTIVFSRGVDFVRHPDEYAYFSWARVILESENIFRLNIISGREAFEKATHESLTLEDFTSFNMMRIIFVQLYSYFFSIVGVGFYQATLFAVFMTCLFIFSIFSLAQLMEDEKGGFLACTFAMTNPAVWIFSNRILNDLMAASFSTISFIFFYKVFYQNQLKNLNAFLGFLAILMSIFINPVSIITFIAISFIGFVHFITKKSRAYLCLLLFMMVSIIILLWAYRDVYLMERGYPIDPIYNLIFRVFLSLKEKGLEYLLFRDPLGFYGTVLYPLIFTHPVMILIFDGIINRFLKRKHFPFILVVVLYLIIIPLTKGEVRRMFPAFPFLFIYASVACKETGYWSLLDIPWFAFLLLVPSKGYVPYFQDPTGLSISDEAFFFSLYLGLVTLFLKLYPLSKNINIRLRCNCIKIHFGEKSVPTLLTLLIVLHALFTGSFIGYHIIKHHLNIAVNETNSIYDFGIPQMADWIIANVSAGSKIMTNSIFELPAYLGEAYQFIEPAGNYRYPSEDIVKLFSLQINDADYVIIFKKNRFDFWFPYFDQFFKCPPPKFTKIYEINAPNGETLSVVYKHGETYKVLSLLNGSWQTFSPEEPSDTMEIKGEMLYYNVSNVVGARKLYFKPSNPLDFSKIKYAALWIYSYEPSSISIEISSPPSITTRLAWYKTLSAGWNLITLSLENPDAKEVYGKIDLSNVNEIRIYPKPESRLIIDLGSGVLIW